MWRTAHPFDAQIALRLICWFPSGSNSVAFATITTNEYVDTSIGQN